EYAAAEALDDHSACRRQSAALATGPVSDSVEWHAEVEPMPEPRRPNILIFFPDAMQAQTLDPRHPCQTPHLDTLVARGTRFTRATTVNPTCSPARASLMTGLLPHNHGVLEVEHVRDADQCNLRTDRAHFAQHLAAA